MDLINRGHGYRFLLKPVSPGRARLAIEASIKHHRDAPESAFRTKSKVNSDVSRPAAKKKAVPKASGKTKSKRASDNATWPKSASSSGRGSVSANKARAAARIAPTISDSPIDGGLDNAFEDEGGFAETMTDIAASLGKTVAGVFAGTKRSASRKSGQEAVAGEPPKKAPADAKQAQEAAVAARQPEKLSADSIEGATFQIPRHKTLGMVGGSIALAAVAAWFVIGWESAPDELTPELSAGTPQSVRTEPADPAPTMAAESPQIAVADASFSPPVQATAAKSMLTVSQVLLDSARAARNAGNLITPAGSNAVALYLVALAETPGDPILEAELNSVVSQVLGMAETAILEQSAARANAALAMARLADPDNRRIAFLDVQVSQLATRGQLDEARVAIRELRLEDAERLIAAAGSLTGADSADINLVKLELAAARNQTLVAKILVTAGERVASGLLITPPNDSARFHYELALAQDPGNQSALQGLTIVASTLVSRASDAIDEGRLVIADDLLRDAATLDPSSSELTVSYAALAAAREAVVEAERQAELVRLAELERQAEAARVAELERLAELERQAEAARVANLEQQAELKRQAEVARQEEIRRQAELARQAEVQRLAELEKQAERQRQTDIERQAQLDRLAQLEQDAEVERQAELLRQAELAKKAELTRLASIERQAEQDRLDEIARHEAAARKAELMEAEQQAAEQNAAAAAASSALGVAAATVKKPVRSAAPAPRTPPVDNQQVTQPDTTTVIVTEVNQGGSLPTTSRQAQMPTGLPQFSGASIGNVGGFSSDGGSTEAAADEVLAISLFTRTNYVPPVYPRSAQRRNLSGAVELEFTVSANGTATNIEVLSSKPGDTFNQAARPFGSVSVLFCEK